jgi:D-lactate dehydrogenase
VNILYDPAEPAQAARADAALEAVFDAVIGLDGQVSGEHGIGLAKRELLARALSPQALALMRAIKAQFDPDGILNPGKVLPPVTEPVPPKKAGSGGYFCATPDIREGIGGP